LTKALLIGSLFPLACGNLVVQLLDVANADQC
jgi:hypothetical protein